MRTLSYWANGEWGGVHNARWGPTPGCVSNNPRAEYCPPAAVVVCSGRALANKGECESRHLDCDCLPTGFCCVEGATVCSTMDCHFDPGGLLMVSSYYSNGSPIYFWGFAAPVPAPLFAGTKRIFGAHAVLADGRVLAFGSNFWGERGDGRSDTPYYVCEEPTYVRNVGRSVTSIASGATSIFLEEDEAGVRVFATGANAGGQAGAPPSIAKVKEPIRVLVQGR